MTSIKCIRDDLLKIFYKGKQYTISITKELEINPAIINSQLENAPSNYAFISLIRDRYIYKRDKLQNQRDQAYSKAWVFFKESGNVSNDLAEHKASIHPKVISITERLDKLNLIVNKLISICKAYESRDRILQTISANIRKN